jgi:chromosome segregation ATPase
VNLEPDASTDLTAVTASVTEATRRLAALRERAPDLHRVAATVEERLNRRAAELAVAHAEGERNAGRILGLRTSLGELDERLGSVRGRLARLAGGED